MKKILSRIVLLVLGIVLCYQHFCYADVVDIGIIDVSTGILSIYFIPIGISVLIIVLGSYFILRREATKGQEINEEMNRKINFNKKLIFIIIAIVIIIYAIFFFSFNLNIIADTIKVLINTKNISG